MIPLENGSPQWFPTEGIAIPQSNENGDISTNGTQGSVVEDQTGDEESHVRNSQDISLHNLNDHA